MISSFRTKAVYEIATILMNSVSKKRRERIMMMPPAIGVSAERHQSLVNGNHLDKR